MVKFAIYLIEEEAYWVTSVLGPSGVTHNYSTDVDDATLFSERPAAKALIRALGLDPEDHAIHTIRTERG